MPRATPGARAPATRAGRRGTCSGSRTARRTSTRLRRRTDGPLRVGGCRRRLIPSGPSAARTRRCGSSGCSSSSGTARRSPSRRRCSAGTSSRRPLGMEQEYDDPRFDDDPDGQRISLDAHIRRANPRTPESDEEPHPAPRVLLQPGVRPRRTSRPGPGLRQLPAQPAEGIPRRAGPAEGRAPRGVHPARGRRLLLRAAGVPEPGRFLGDALVA